MHESLPLCEGDVVQIGGRDDTAGKVEITASGAKAAADRTMGLSLCFIKEGTVLSYPLFCLDNPPVDGLKVIARLLPRGVSLYCNLAEGAAYRAMAH